MIDQEIDTLIKLQIILTHFVSNVVGKIRGLYRVSSSSKGMVERIRECE